MLTSLLHQSSNSHDQFLSLSGLRAVSRNAPRKAMLRHPLRVPGSNGPQYDEDVPPHQRDSSLRSE
jgi:hypothetical protein